MIGNIDLAIEFLKNEGMTKKAERLIKIRGKVLHNKKVTDNEFQFIYGIWNAMMN
jgi:hypothetical protein